MIEKLSAIALLLLAVACSGCGGALSPDADQTTIEAARVAVAGIFAFAEPTDSPAPEPAPPTPTPGVCDRCNGTGRIKPDGRIEINCPDCDGDGKRHTPNELLREMIVRFDRLNTTLDTNHKSLITLVATQSNPAQPADTSPPVQQPPAAPLEPVWLTNLSEARRQGAAEKKPILVHWYGPNCQPCLVMEANVFPDEQVAEILATDFVCVRCDASRADRATQLSWGANRIPVDCVVVSDWSSRRTLDRTLDPNNFAAQLTAALVWATKKAETNRTTAVELSQQLTQEFSMPVQEMVYFEGPVIYRPPSLPRVMYRQPTFGRPAWGGPMMSCGPGGCW